MNRINTKRERIARFYGRLAEMGFTYQESEQLRRIELTLQRWAERECGDGSNWGLERDEQTGKPCMVWHGEGKSRRYPTADREAGALRRLAKLIETRNLRHFAPNTDANRISEMPGFLLSYHQGDCRGCMLWLVRREDVRPGESLDSVYTRGFAVCI